jgi:hypothetical protein
LRHFAEAQDAAGRASVNNAATGRRHPQFSATIFNDISTSRVLVRAIAAKYRYRFEYLPRTLGAE